MKYTFDFVYDVVHLNQDQDEHVPEHCMCMRVPEVSRTFQIFQDCTLQKFLDLFQNDKTLNVQASYHNHMVCDNAFAITLGYDI